MRKLPITRVVADNINRLMAASGHSNLSLERGTRGRVKKSTIGRMRNGEISAGINNVEEVARAFGLEAWQLLVPAYTAVDAAAASQSSGPTRALENATKELLELFHRLDDRDRSLLLADAKKYLDLPPPDSGA